MSDRDDLLYEMRLGKIDEDTTDRLLAGRIDPDDAPPGYAEVARILQAAGSLPRSEHLSREVEHVAAAREAMSLRSPSIGGAGGSPTRRHRMLDPAQHAVSRVLDKVGISVPGNETHPASTGQAISSIATTTTSTGVAKGAEISTAASGGKSQAGQHGRAGQTGAPSQLPSVGGTGTADAASGGKSTHGTAKANEKSGGRSMAGSGNARAGSG